ncbi:MAG: deoxynucleoside kinase [Bacteroidia bacterium]
MLNYRYIVIEGNIGAGKTTVAKMLAEQFDGHLVLEEFADNTFLPQFYDDPRRFAFPLEMSFMAERYRQLTGVFYKRQLKIHPVISDYLFDKSLLFAKANLNKNELILFKNFFDLVKNNLAKPDLLVYLKKDVKMLKKNIQKRGRDFETGITDNYLHRINKLYDGWMAKNQKTTKTLMVNSDELDFVNEPEHFKWLVNRILGQ